MEQKKKKKKKKSRSVALKRGDAEVCLLDVDENHEVVTLKKALLIPSYPQDIFSVKVAMKRQLFLKKIKTNSSIKVAQSFKYTSTKDCIT